MSDFGYAGKILRVNLSDGKIDYLDTSGYAGRFLGGRGMAAKIYWDETTPDTKAFEPENCLIFITGPLAGFTRFAGCRWQICGKTAAMDPESFSYANLGGSWGAWLKYAGYDGLVVKGKSRKSVYIVINNGSPVIKDAGYLKGKTTHQTEALLRQEYGKEARVLSTGPAGENMVSFATVLASEGASGSSGFGGVMGSKNLKALVIRQDSKIQPVAADIEELNRIAKQVYELRTQNYEDYEHIMPLKIQRKACYGCISGCSRGYYKADDGFTYKSLCAAAGVYFGPAMRYYGGMTEETRQVGNLGTRLCDEYSLDTSVVSPLIEWLSRCYREGILNDGNTGLPLSKIGSVEFINEFIRKVSFREGFGDILAQGTRKAAEYVGKSVEIQVDPGMITPGNESLDYDPRYILAHAMIYATEPRRAIQLLHSISLPVSRWNNWRDGWEGAFLSSEVFQDIAEKYWGSREAGNLVSSKDKALAAKLVQDYGYVKESMILCDFVWPLWQVRDIDNSIRNLTLESRILSAITGRQVDELELMKIGERNVNMQRSVLMRQGWGGKNGDIIHHDLFEKPLQFIFFSPECMVPGKDGKAESKKGTILRKDEFENIRDEYYRLRNWDNDSGYQTKGLMVSLDLAEEAEELNNIGLLSDKKYKEVIG
jgi:aldehyde:ferredoxin oxidoreductase